MRVYTEQKAKQLTNAVCNCCGKKLLVENGENFNSLKTLHSSLAKYSHFAGLTIREFKDIVIETVRLCNNFYEPVRAEWLTCLMTYKNKTKSGIITILSIVSLLGRFISSNLHFTQLFMNQASHQIIFICTFNLNLNHVT